MTDKLEACPFCGVVPQMQSHTQEDEMDEGRYVFFVECGNGKCPMGLVSTGGPYKESAKAAERWNSRTSVAAPPPERGSLLRDPVKIDVTAVRDLPPVIVTRDGVACEDQQAALEEFKQRCRVSSEQWQCSRQPWRCRYPNARQCAHDTMLGDECPKVCECECHDPAAPSPVAVDAETDILDDERVDKELRRWQDAIRDKMNAMGVPDYKIDGAGCDSGDPLDFTLAEVGQGLAYFIDQLEELRAAAPSDSSIRAAAAEIRELCDKEAPEIPGDSTSYAPSTDDIAAILSKHLHPVNNLCFPKPCVHCNQIDCECSDFDVSPDMGAKG